LAYTVYRLSNGEIVMESGDDHESNKTLDLYSQKTAVASVTDALGILGWCSQRR